MKKLICISLLLTLICTAAYAEEWVSIGELQEQTPERWKQTYETKWRTITVDAEIHVPEVAKAPVLLIEGGADTTLLTAEHTGWVDMDAYHGFSLRWDNPWPDYPSKLDGKRLDSGQYGGTTWYSGFEADGCYVPMSETTLGDICDMADETLTRSGIEPGEYTYRSPFQIRAQRMFYYGQKKDALPGTLFVEFRAKLEGIPVLSHIFQSIYTEGGWARDDEFLEYPNNTIIYHGYGEYMGVISLWRANLVEVLAEDIPLLPFERIASAIEAEINVGHIRKIYEIELGYVLYNEPGKYREAKPGDASIAESAAARYYLRPMWQVNCLYKDTATGKLRSKPSDSDDERNTLDYYQLLIDAQTGEVVKRNSAKDRCEYKGFISWEDVQ